MSPMENNTDNNGFVYTYSSKEQDELKRIRDKYINKEEDKLDKLRRLDHSVTERAQIGSLTVGIIGSLILGTGMSLAMKVIGATLSFAMPLGICVGVVGIALVCVNYPIYKRILKSRKQKYSQQILALSDSLLNE